MTNANHAWVSQNIKLEPVVTPSHGSVRLDGIFGINYTNAYAAAWQHLMGSCNELAIPILYLQRHTLELVLKDLIGVLLSTRDEMALCRDVFGADSAGDAGVLEDWAEDARLINSCHSFEELFGSLERNLMLLKLPELPQASTRRKHCCTKWRTGMRHGYATGL